MAVSLSHVQGVLNGLPGNGGAGQLTLNVLNKTEALLAQLRALDASKPQTVEVLKALANGRAEVQVGALKLDVKSSLPLKAGEVFQLKFEQVGSALRFVPPPVGESKARDGRLPDAPSGHDRATGQGKEGVPGGPPAGLAKKATPPGAAALYKGGQPGAKNDGAPPPSHLRGSDGGKAPLRGPAGNAPEGAARSQTLTATRSADLVGARADGASGRGTALPPSSLLSGSGHRGGPENLQRALVARLPGGPVQSNSAGATSAGFRPQGPLTQSAAALARVMTEILPDIARQAGLAKLPLAGRRALTGDGTGSARPLNADSAGMEARARASEVTAQYKMTGQAAGDEALDGRSQAQRPADLTLSFTFTDGRSPLHLGLYLERDPRTREEARERGFGLRFSFESEETGPVHAEISLQGEVMRLGLWAGRQDMADLIENHIDELEMRLSARGLQLGGLIVRQGPGPGAFPQTHAQMDEEI